MNEPLLNTNRPSRRGLILRMVGTAFSMALLLYLIWSQGWGEFKQALSLIPWQIFGIAIGLTLSSRVCVTLRWLVLLRSASAKISFWQAFRLMFMGNFASNFLPSTVGGDMVRLAGVVSLGVDAAVGAASLVLDRLIGMVGMASFGPYGLYLISQRPVGLGGPVYAPSLAIFASLRRVPVFDWIYRKAEPFVRSLMASTLNWFRRPVSLLLALLCTYGHMLFIFLVILVLLRAMHQPVSFVVIGALWSLSYFVALVPVSINGLGLQEVSITMLYSRFGGVSMESALALAVLMRLLFLLASLPGALFLPEILKPIPRKEAVNAGSESAADKLAG